MTVTWGRSSGSGSLPSWGPFHYVDQEGAVEVVRRLEELERKFGERFKPAPLLVEHARTGAPLAER